MQKKEGTCRRQLRMSFFRAYMLVLLVPILCVAAVYGLAFFQLQVHSQQTVRTLLENSAYNVDAKVLQYDSELQNLTNNKDIQTLLAHDQFERGSAQIADAYRVILNTNRKLCGDSSIFDYYIYPNKGDITISSKTVHLDAGSFYDSVYKWSAYSREEWEKYISGNSHERFVIPAANTKKGIPGGEASTNTRGNVITLVRTLPVSDLSEQNGYVALFLGEQEILRLLKSLDIGDNGFVRVFDENGVLISSSGAAPDGFSMDVKQLKESDGKMVRLGGKKFAVSSVKSPLLGWTFAVAMPFLHPAGILKNLPGIFFFPLLLSFVIGSAAAVYLSQKNASPWDLFADEFKLTGRDRTIQNAAMKIWEAVRNNKELNVFQRELLIRVRSGILRELLSPCTNRKRVDDISEALDISLDAPYYCLIYVHFSKENDKHGQEKYIMLFQDLIEKSGREVLGEEPADKWFALILLNAADRKTVIEEAAVTAAKQSGESCVFAISYIFAEPEETYPVRLSLEKAMRENTSAAKEQQGCEIIWLTAPESIRNRRFFVPIDFEISLLEQIKLTNVLGVKMLFEDIRNSNMCSDMISAILLREQVCAAVARVLCNVGCEMGEIAEITGKISSLPSDESITYASQKLSEVAVSYCETNREEDRMIEYVKDRYSDSGLCIDHMKTAFSVSSRMLQLAFFQKTGKTFSDYLEWLRLEKACRLLSDHTIQVMDVAEAVGYENDHSFRRAFKRRFGIKPYEFRKYINYNAGILEPHRSDFNPKNEIRRRSVPVDP